MSQSTVQKVNAIKKGQRFINKSRTVPEVFDIIRDAESKEEKIALLRAYDTKALQYIINGMYNVDWSGLPVPKIKFNHRPPEICNANLNTSLTRIESAYKHRFDNPENAKRNLVRILEEVSEREARLLLDMFKGKKVQGISKAVFKEAYPSFFLSEDETQTTQAETETNQKES